MTRISHAVDLRRSAVGSGEHGRTSGGCRSGKEPANFAEIQLHAMPSVNRALAAQNCRVSVTTTVRRRTPLEHR